MIKTDYNDTIHQDNSNDNLKSNSAKKRHHAHSSNDLARVAELFSGVLKQVSDLSADVKSQQEQLKYLLQKIHYVEERFSRLETDYQVSHYSQAEKVEIVAQEIKSLLVEVNEIKAEAETAALDPDDPPKSMYM